jgi:malate synthase
MTTKKTPHKSQTEVLTPAVIDFILKLHGKFEEPRKKLLDARALRAQNITDGEEPKFLAATESVRLQNWKVADTPADLQDRRVEITGPAEPKMIINALNCGAQVFMADFEDSLSPNWGNILDGHKALTEAVRKTLSFQNESGKNYSLDQDSKTTLIVRPRGLHLLEENFQIVDGDVTEVISASLFDFGVYFFHNAKVLLSQKRTPAFYLPKLESHLEARWWNQVFVEAQRLMQIPQGSIRATVLIETILAAFEMDEILFELKEHSSGLNAGRWDYIFSLIKKNAYNSKHILPDRAQVTMATGFMSSYAELLVQTCHRRGAHAIGGMAAFIPNRKEPEVTRAALEKVAQDKAREAALGFDGSWVAHPDLISVAFKEFEKVLGTKLNQKEKMPTRKILAADLLNTSITGGEITEQGIRNNINVSLQYIERWLSGVGAVAINNLMEDAATAEISRSQLWQWLHFEVEIKTIENTKVHFNRDLYLIWRSDEMKKIQQQLPAPRIERAMTILDDLVLQKEFCEFLTLKAYHRLLVPEQLFINWSLANTNTDTKEGVLR